MATAITPGGRVVGFDLDADQLDVARLRARGAGFGRAVRFEEGDACALYDVPDDSFDRAVCRKLLIHLSRPLEALREMARVVRGGGLVVAIEPDELAARLAWWDSASSLDPELPALRAEVHSRIALGARRVGGGDRRLGPALPALLRQAGLEQPQLRVDATAPDPATDLDLILARLDEAIDTPVERDLFAAADGDPDLWIAWQRAERIARGVRQQQLAAGDFRATTPELLHICAARVPAGVSSRR